KRHVAGRADCRLRLLRRIRRNRFATLAKRPALSWLVSARNSSWQWEAARVQNAARRWPPANGFAGAASICRRRAASCASNRWRCPPHKRRSFLAVGATAGKACGNESAESLCFLVGATPGKFQKLQNHALAQVPLCFLVGATLGEGGNH